MSAERIQDQTIDRQQILSALELAKAMVRLGSPYIREPAGIPTQREQRVWYAHNVSGLQDTLWWHRLDLDKIIERVRAGAELHHKHWPAIHALRTTLRFLHPGVGDGREFDPDNPDHADFFAARQQIWEAARVLGAW